MTKRPQLLVVIAVSLAANLQPGCAAAEPTWQLRQTSKLNGQSVILLTPKAIRIDNPQRKISIIARAPSWELSVWNHKSCKFIKIPLKKWRGPFSECLALADDYYSAAPVRATGETRAIRGIATRHYGMKSKPTGDPTQILQMDYWLAQNLNVPPEVCTILRRYHKLPESAQGLPILMTYVDVDGTTVELDTTSATRQQSDSASAFSTPSGFQLMHKPEDVMMSTGSMSNMRYMIDVFDSLRESKK